MLEDLDPAFDVGGVPAGVVADAERVADHEGGDLGAECCIGVRDAAEAMGQVPVQSGGVTTPPNASDRQQLDRVASRRRGVAASCPVDLGTDTPSAVRKRRRPGARTHQPEALQSGQTGHARARSGRPLRVVSTRRVSWLPCPLSASGHGGDAGQ